MKIIPKFKEQSSHHYIVEFEIPSQNWYYGERKLKIEVIFCPSQLDKTLIYDCDYDDDSYKTMEEWRDQVAMLADTPFEVDFLLADELIEEIWKMEFGKSYDELMEILNKEHSRLVPALKEYYKEQL